MASKSSIEWTDSTWNPVTGCTKVSAGCKHCYAERMARRLQAMGVAQYRDGFAVSLAPQVLGAPFEWNTPRRVFVNSMSDLFHEEVPIEYIQDVFAVMRETPQHVYQILTKRSTRLKDLSFVIEWPANVWMGVSVENKHTTPRIADLRQCGAAVKFLSIEPLIGPVGAVDLRDIDWVIVGGESGPRARPTRRVWIDEIKAQCKLNNVPFFFKQWGAKRFNDNPSDPTMDKEHEHYAKGGCQLGGRIYRAFPVGSAAIGA